MVWVTGLMMTILTLTGCPSTQVGNGITGVVKPPVVQSVHTTDFDRALAAGDLDAAREALATLQADPVHDDLAALLSARLDRASGDLERARASFGRLGTGNDDVAQAARIYEAVVTAELGDLDGAGRLVATWLDRPNAYVALNDTPAAALVVAHGLRTSGDAVASLEVLALGLSAAEFLDDLEMADHLVARAFALGADVDPSKAREVVETAPPLVRAVAGDVLVRSLFVAGNASEAGDVLRAVSPDLAFVGAFERITELERLLQLESAGPGRAVIGAILPLSGDARRVGRTVLAGILQAQGVFFSGGGRRLTIVFRDSQSSADASASAVTDLSELGALAIIGPLGAEPSFAAGQRAIELGIPLISLAARADAVPDGAYRFGIDIDAEIAALVADTIGRGQLLAAIARPESEYGKTMSDLFAEAFYDAGGEIVRIETYATDAVDLRKLAESLVEVQFDVLFVPDASNRAILVSSFLAQENVWSAHPGVIAKEKDPRRFVTYLGTSAWYEKDLADRAGRYLDGAAFPTSYAREAETELNTLFVDTFGKLYDREPGLYEAMAYDVTRLLRDLVMNRGLLDRTQLADALSTMEPRNGVTGAFSFVGGHASPTPQLLRVSLDGTHPVEPIAQEPEEAPLAPPAAIEGIDGPGDAGDPPAQL